MKRIKTNYFFFIYSYPTINYNYLFLKDVFIYFLIFDIIFLEINNYNSFCIPIGDVVDIMLLMMFQFGNARNQEKVREEEP